MENEIKVGEEVDFELLSEETMKELSNGKGDDEPCQTAD